MSSNSLTIPNKWRPRQHQERLYRAFGYGLPYRRGCAVWHRRAGKDSVALNLTARDMFRRVGTYWHLFPEQAQARRAIWNGIDGQGRRILDQVFPAAVRRRTSAQEMLIETVNGSIWQMAGSDNFDSLVGSNPVGVVFSEWALADPEAWEYIRPILVENDGWALFIYTPRGHNHGYATWLRALEAESWFSERLTVEETGLITPEQIAAERRAGMSEGKIRQEFYCSFEAACDEQLIAQELVSEAMAREAVPERFDEKVIGVDVARFGDDHRCREPGRRRLPRRCGFGAAYGLRAAGRATRGQAGRPAGRGLAPGGGDARGPGGGLGLAAAYHARRHHPAPPARLRRAAGDDGDAQGLSPGPGGLIHAELERDRRRGARRLPSRWRRGSERCRSSRSPSCGRPGPRPGARRRRRGRGGGC